MKKKRLVRNSVGFTVVELLVVMVIVSILSLGISEFIAYWIQDSTRNIDQSNLLTTAENALTYITNDIMLSGNVDAINRWPDPNGPGGNQYGWTSGSQTLILAKLAVDSSGNAIYTDPTKYITQKDDEIYFLSGTTLYRRTLKSDSSNDAAVTTCPSSDSTSTCPPDEVIATGVTSLLFTYWDINGDETSNVSNAKAVQVAITISKKLDTQTISASYTTRMVFRNE